MLIADDHPLVRLAMEALLRTAPDMKLVGQAADGEEAVRQAQLTLPDVVVLDARMPTKDGLAALVEIKQVLPAAHCLVLTGFYDADQALQAIKLGAAGYLLKDAGPEELLRAIRAVYRGESTFHPAATHQLIEAYRVLQGGSAPRGADLTPAELRVLKLLPRGLSNREIAIELGVSVRTITSHVGHILTKLGVQNRVQAALYAKEHGLTE